MPNRRGMRNAASRLEHPPRWCSRVARIADALTRHEADILVLSEYRGGESAKRLLGALNTLGYAYVTALAPPPRFNGVLIAARCPFLEYGGGGSRVTAADPGGHSQNPPMPPSRHLHTNPPPEKPYMWPPR